MLCENCGKKDATSIYLPPKESKIKYLCGECYRTLNNSTELENLAYIASQNLEIDDMCKTCGTKFSDFNSSGLFGCADCYKVFNEYITKKFLPKFSEQKYLGKKPNLFYVNEEIKNLEQLIELYLKNGNFQMATKYGKELDKLKEENYGKL